MLKHVLFAVLGIFTFSATAQSHWTKSELSKFKTVSQDDLMTLPKAYDSYILTFDEIQEELADAPAEKVKRNNKPGKMIRLPIAGGEFETFEVYYSPVMAPGLASRYSSIRSYKGFSTKNKSKSVRFSIGPYGFHAAIHGIDKTIYIDPYSRTSTEEYVVYDVKDHLSVLDIEGPLCGTADLVQEEHSHESIQTRSSQSNIPLRVYRLALACTGEWGAPRGTPENALADMVTGVNRLNQIFENDIAIRLILIEDNDLLLNFDGDTDPYNLTFNSMGTVIGSGLLSANTAIVNERVGLGSYDIGHVYHTRCDVGGVARLGSMCNNGSKAAALTCHYSNSLDFMAASVTSHEMGHQMTAQHTFNFCGGSNESPGNAYEPGSGSTIMSYGGLCEDPSINTANNVVGPGQGDDYFHTASLIQIYNHTRDGGLADGCAEIITTSNDEPEITIEYENLFNIPEDTYFFLEGSATDANDDELTYCWEQFNIGPLSPLGEPIGTAPRFRSFPPSSSPTRYFPQPAFILNGQYTQNEVMPQGDMDLTFMFTVRDNNPEAGASVYESIRFNTVNLAEKFEVTSQNTGVISKEVGEKLEVTWNVANTDQAPINAKFVDILLNTSSAGDFDIHNMPVLASRVPNNGSATVYLPNVITNKGRIIVRASDNIFFSINKRNVQVKEPTEPSVFFEPEQSSYAVCLPQTPDVTLLTQGFVGLEGDVQLSVIDGLPEDATATFEPAVVTTGEQSLLTIDYPSTTISGQYNITVRALVEGQDTFERDIIMYVTSTDFSALNTLTPVNGNEATVAAPTFNWTPTPNADSYKIEVATTPSFGSSTVINESSLTDSFFVSSIVLDNKTVYYWRVTPTNICSDGIPTKISAFSTEVLTCAEYSPNADDFPYNLSQSGKPTIEAVVAAVGGGIADVNVRTFVGEHDNNKDLVVNLISPAGTEVLLFSKICLQQSDFNCQFDDASNSAVKCPLNSGVTYRPKGTLSDFNGESAEGDWILRVEDTESGNGGKLEEFTLEICANVDVKSPYVVRNNLLKLPWGGSPAINSSKLKIEDEDHPSSQLEFTVTETPTIGKLIFDGNEVLVGDHFTQKDVNDNKLTYNGESEDYTTFFSFTVIDGAGGFLGVTNFDIEVSELNSTFDPSVALEVSVYPVPSSDVLTIDMTASEEVFTSYDIVNINGQTVAKSNINNTKKVSVDVSYLPTGVYFINLRNDRLSIPKKIIVE